jgi:ubiquinone/menaquinone biosynthesis C-methylase UbiE
MEAFCLMRRISQIRKKKMGHIENTGQDKKVWTDSWGKYSVESLIQKWDYWGLRQWILKFVPRQGKTLEAGCGLGRNNFYLESLGIEIDGLDFSDETISLLNSWEKKNGYHSNFIQGNITKLPYSNNSLSCYISLGVIEHFIEGPQEALAEAYRVLRPGGIAIITTPGVSFYIFFFTLKNQIKKVIKKLLFIKSTPRPFFQYWYNSGKLKKFIEEAGFYVSRYSSADLMYAFCEASGFNDKWVKKGSFGYWFSQKFETSLLKFLGAQSVTISVKIATMMHCFFCGELRANQDSLNIYDVPVCKLCSDERNDLARLYIIKRKVTFAQPYIIKPPILIPVEGKCSFCDKDYTTDLLFEDYGFNRPVCKSCLKKSEVNILLSNMNVKPVWRG